MIKPPPSPPPAFLRISDRDLTEIELHSVDSINDLHRTHSEQAVKGTREEKECHRSSGPPPPSTNGNLQIPDRPVVCQTGYPMRRPPQSQVSDICTPSRWRYSLVCVALTLTLLTLILIFSFLVQQRTALQTLSETVKERQETAQEISVLIQELLALRRNLTTLRGSD